MTRTTTRRADHPRKLPARCRARVAMRSRLALALCAGLFGCAPALAVTAPWVSTDAGAAGFALVREGRAAALWCDATDHTVVRTATEDLAADVERVTGTRPLVNSDVSALRGPVVLIGTLGQSALIDDLVRRERLDVRRVSGQWETFLIGTVRRPLPAVPEALVIVGSDRRGTAFGAYELSQAIGVSPWYFWADVTPDRERSLIVAAGTRRFGPPSVRYRGIFLNDEDWGLQRWAARTFDPETGDIGPKTYRRVFELLLRLKANTLWPAMHACTRPFNADPASARLADEYAIVMGSSHAEPMLRNNVREWTAPHPDYNYVTNREGVRAYWEERVRTNGRFENVYTLGMRGIHDSDIQGTRTAEERVRVLEQVFADQRALLLQHVDPQVERVPQMFCAYKEVLALYRAGLKVPDDVTIVWPDDNFGFIRSFASADERRRAGGFGVYYHISYLGSPLAYLWLGTTPPALIWEEMNKAYDHGADRIWIVNVGDIKPAEIGTELFLQMAWDGGRWRRDNLPRFLKEWATREFGATQAAAIADVMDEYYRLNFQRKPEHLQWWLPAEKPRASALAPHEIR
jgi:Glycosyl hydrolase family 115